MEPRIQYATTSDGVSIAYRTLGEGRPYLHMPSIPVSHIDLHWRDPEFRRAFERTAQRRMVVLYDNRGSGSSERKVRDLSLNAQVRDLEAVADALRLEPFVLWASGFSGSVAIAYAARHPERVSHLILWCTWSGGTDLGRWSVLLSALYVTLVTRDWNMFLETGARQSVGWSTGGDHAHRLAAIAREAVTPQLVRKAFGLRGFGRFNAGRYLAQVKAPTLVLHRRQVAFPKEEVARRLGARIPGARLVLLEGDSMVPSLGDRRAVARAVNAFLGEELLDEAEPEADVAGGALVTVLFTDMESSTALTQRLGDEQAQKLLRAHNAIVREALAAQGGTEIKHTGDGIMASFPTASGALECAVAILRAVAQRNEPDLQVHVGLNAGEPVAEDEDLFGTAVQLARRICDQAEGGEILVSDVVRQLAAGKGFLFADRGAAALKGFEDPVRLYEVRWRAEGSPEETGD